MAPTGEVSSTGFETLCQSAVKTAGIPAGVGHEISCVTSAKPIFIPSAAAAEHGGAP
jgi:hypothetical protein